MTQGKDQKEKVDSKITQLNDINNLVVNFKNDHAIVVDKPSLYLSVPSRFNDIDTRPVMGLLLQKFLGTQVWPVHRLDYEASGLLIFALTPEFHKCAQKWFEQKVISKSYAAITEINRQSDLPVYIDQHWQHKIVRGKKRSFFAEYGKDCSTLARLDSVLTKDGLNLGSWTLQPETGRPHQLRLELSHHGYPIWGDTLYGAKYPKKTPGIALRAVKIDFNRCKEYKSFGLPEVISISGFSI